MKFAHAKPADEMYIGNPRDIPRVILRSFFCINVIKGGTMFAKSKLKYERGRCDRGIVKGTFHLVGNNDFLISSLSYFSFPLSQSAVHQTHTTSFSGEEGKEITQEKRNLREAA